MISQKEYVWQNTNIALIGSKEDRAAKFAEAEQEKAWKKVLAAAAPALLVWRVQKFKLVEVQPEEHGYFFDGDTYIVLNIHSNGNDSNYDLHFWIGRHSTPDEYGTAAYKVVELDTLLGDKAIQHREVQEFESDLFLTYFKCMRTLSGGYESAFRHVEPTQYQPRLLHFRLTGRRNVAIEEVTKSRKSLRSDDVFILDLGQVAYQWNGRVSNKEERIRAAQFLQELESERNGRCQTEVLDEADLREDHEFYKSINNDDVRKKPEFPVREKKALYKLSDESGKLVFELVTEGKIQRSLLSAQDVFFIDSGKELFVYIGNGCSFLERRNAMSYAHEYLKTSANPLESITVVGAGQTCHELEKVWDD